MTSVVFIIAGFIFEVVTHFSHFFNFHFFSKKSMLSFPGVSQVIVLEFRKACTDRQ